jgi:hypothetical protein
VLLRPTRPDFLHSSSGQRVRKLDASRSNLINLPDICALEGSDVGLLPSSPGLPAQQQQTRGAQAGRLDTTCQPSPDMRHALEDRQCRLLRPARPGLPAGSGGARGQLDIVQQPVNPPLTCALETCVLQTARPGFLHSSSGRAVRKLDASCSNLSTLP